MSQVQQFIVHGRVQGVGFRASAQATARRLGLTGWVRNRDDGSVEAFVGGEPDTLQAFHAWLEQGPGAGHVDRVERHEADASCALPEPFAIR